MDEKILAILDKGRGLQMEIKLVKVENEEFIVFKDAPQGGSESGRAYVFSRELIDDVGATLLKLAAKGFDVQLPPQVGGGDTVATTIAEAIGRGTAGVTVQGGPLIEEQVGPEEGYATTGRRKYKIIRNSARCRNCGDEIESKHRHDWVQCSCGAIFVDGGKNYLRSGGDPQYFISTSISEEIT